VPGAEYKFGGNVPCDALMIISMAASRPFPVWIMLYQRRPVGSASIVGSPAKSCGKKPMFSAWSATTRKSSGRASFARWPLDAVSSSPLAKR
jgi:hypothetical protein